ncbi:MAG: energy transducer TonB [Sphingomicrobium sp.]
MDDRATSDWTRTRPRERLITLAIVGLVHLAILLVLLTTSSLRLQRVADQPMQLITLRPPQPPPASPKPQARPAEAHTAAAPPPPAKRRQPPLKPLPTIAPVAIAAADTILGASVGSGASLGSIGTGIDIGSGGGGGGSGGGGISRHAEWVGGGLSKHDYPEAAKRAGLEGVVDVRFTVLTDGRVKGCKIDHSSGSVDLDRLTCALTEQRLLYNPALDASGKPVEEVAGRRFRFVLDRHRR